MADTRYDIRPLGVWDRPVTVNRAASHRFKANWSETLDLLTREVDLLGAALVVVQIDVTDGEIRRDGMLRANARVGFPGVKVSFDSRYGPLTYATDAYEQQYGFALPGWQANVRAIALGLEALRAVDRYGVTRSGEQYRGWTAIAATSGEFDMTREQAATLLAAETSWTAGDLLADPDKVAAAFRIAARKHHPDVGGDTELFRRLAAARDLLAGDRG
ncbi:J domain-containing protein [Micromonospora lupini]|uniref:J domain-containing protein n=1 Tax=Micromonospora lupini TaxID=285679 RepID=UPI0022562DB4|nr:J domain-containing protein [Micromonospora lupini]MCX5066603.1 J domain-containing protein [Micromonospora lupini]